MITRAHTGSGKTFAYLLPVLQKLFSELSSQTKLAPTAFIIVPTRELCQQVLINFLKLLCVIRLSLNLQNVVTVVLFVNVGL